MTSLQRFYLVLADLVLMVHAAFVAFVIVGLVLIWIGWLRRWAFVIVGLVLIWIGWLRRWAFVCNFWFRVAHLAAIVVVVAESVAGFVCPLTSWEDRLRLLAGGEERYQGSFIQHWLHQVMFFDLSENVFTIIYLAFFLAVALGLWLVPPRWPRRDSGEIKQPAKPTETLK